MSPKNDGTSCTRSHQRVTVSDSSCYYWVSLKPGKYIDTTVTVTQMARSFKLLIWKSIIGYLCTALRADTTYGVLVRR